MTCFHTTKQRLWQRPTCLWSQKYLLSGPFTEKVCQSLDYTVIAHSPFHPLQWNCQPRSPVTSWHQTQILAHLTQLPTVCNYLLPLAPTTEWWISSSLSKLPSLLYWPSLHQPTLGLSPKLLFFSFSSLIIKVSFPLIHRGSFRPLMKPMDSSRNNFLTM